MADTFALNIARFVDKAGKNASTVVRKIGIETLKSVVLKSPVGNPENWKSPPPKGYVGGRLRANWNVSFNSPDTATTERTDKTGAATITRGTAALANADTERPIYIMNSLPYVRRIEYQGWSAQAPAGMVRVTVAEMQFKVNEIVRSLPK